jgi:hypothetical protein
MNRMTRQKRLNHKSANSIRPFMVTFSCQLLTRLFCRLCLLPTCRFFIELPCPPLSPTLKPPGDLKKEDASCHVMLVFLLVEIERPIEEAQGDSPTASLLLVSMAAFNQQYARHMCRAASCISLFHRCMTETSSGIDEDQFSNRMKSRVEEKLSCST